MKNILFCLIMMVLFFSCNSSKNKKKELTILDIDTSEGVLTSNMNKLYWGINENIKPDTANPLEMAMFHLNNSDYKGAYSALRKKYLLDTIIGKGIYGFMCSGSYQPNKYKVYTFYRFNDYSDNVIRNTLENEFVGGAIYDSSKPELRGLQEVEDNYAEIKNYSDKIDTNNARKLIPKLLNAKKAYKNARRLDFLLLNEYIIVNDSSNAMKVADKLVKENYYSLPTLRHIIKYLSGIDNSQAKKYIFLLDKMYPSECNLFKIKSSISTANENSILNECKKCYISDFRIDSMYARLLLVKYYFENKQYEKANIYLNEYLDKWDEGMYIKELGNIRGQYYDLKLRILFMKGNFEEFCKLINYKMQINPVVPLDDPIAFKSYIQKLYRDYISSDGTRFDAFYQKNFYKIKV